MEELYPEWYRKGRSDQSTYGKIKFSSRLAFVDVMNGLFFEKDIADRKIRMEAKIYRMRIGLVLHAACLPLSIVIATAPGMPAAVPVLLGMANVSCVVSILKSTKFRAKRLRQLLSLDSARRDLQ